MESECQGSRRQTGVAVIAPHYQMGSFGSNKHSLCNKLEDIQSLVRKSPVLCFTKMWLCELITDSGLQLAGIHLKNVVVSKLAVLINCKPLTWGWWHEKRKSGKKMYGKKISDQNKETIRDKEH